MPTTRTNTAPTCGTPTAGPRELSPLTERQAADLTELFKVLANDTRLRLLHALARAGELCVGGLAEAVSMTPQAVSNQLQRLADRGVLAARRQGNNIFYRVVNPCVTDLLDRGLCLVEKDCPAAD